MSPTDLEKTTGSLTFVIPIVHPDNPKISDYSVVENVLKLTIDSLLAQTATGTRILIVCNRPPAWKDTVPETVTFLSLGDHPGFPPVVENRQRDRGMKHLASMWYALQHHDPALIMPMDGDDFIRTDLADSFLERAKGAGDEDGYIISSGYHMAISDTPSGSVLKTALQVLKYDWTCGSCRVILAPKIKERLLAFAPAFKEFGPDDIAEKDGTLKHAFLDCIVETADHHAEDPDSLIEGLGRHIRQAKVFDFKRINEPFSAKRCGHGNHAGPKGGGVHWHRAVKTANNRAVMAEFGLNASQDLKAGFSLKYVMLGLAGRVLNKVRG